MRRLAVVSADPRVIQNPGAAGQLGALRVDTPLHMIFRAIEKHDYFVEAHALVGNAQGVDDGLLVGISLTQPQAVGRNGKLRRLTLDVSRFQRRELTEHARRHRRHRQHNGHTDPDGNRQRRDEKVPGGNAGCARCHKLLAARKSHEAEHAAQKHRKRQEFLSEIGKLQECHSYDNGARNATPGCAVDQIDDVDRKSEQQKRRIDDGHAEQKLAPQITI